MISEAFDLDQLGNWTKAKTDLNGDADYTDNLETEVRGSDALNKLVSQQVLDGSTRRPLTG